MCFKDIVMIGLQYLSFLCLLCYLFLLQSLVIVGPLTPLYYRESQYICGPKLTCGPSHIIFIMMPGPCPVHYILILILIGKHHVNIGQTIYIVPPRWIPL